MNDEFSTHWGFVVMMTSQLDSHSCLKQDRMWVGHVVLWTFGNLSDEYMWSCEEEERKGQRRQKQNPIQPDLLRRMSEPEKRCL